jgi:hypothetical protein
LKVGEDFFQGGLVVAQPIRNVRHGRIHDPVRYFAKDVQAIAEKDSVLVIHET